MLTLLLCARQAGDKTDGYADVWKALFITAIVAITCYILFRGTWLTTAASMKYFMFLPFDVLCKVCVMYVLWTGVQPSYLVCLSVCQQQLACGDCVRVWMSLYVFYDTMDYMNVRPKAEE